MAHPRKRKASPGLTIGRRCIYLRGSEKTEQTVIPENIVTNLETPKVLVKKPTSPVRAATPIKYEESPSPKLSIQAKSPSPMSVKSASPVHEKPSTSPVLIQAKSPSPVHSKSPIHEQAKSLSPVMTKTTSPIAKAISPLPLPLIPESVCINGLDIVKLFLNQYANCNIIFYLKSGRVNGAIRRKFST